MKRFAYYQLPVVLWAITIFILSSIPKFPELKVPLGTDKFVHVIVYFVFCWLSYRAFKYQEKYPLLQTYAAVCAILLTALYGYLDEVHQLYVEGRSYDLYDWAADTFGAFLFLIVLWGWQKFKTTQFSTE